MNGKIISIKEMREQRDPEWFIKNVLNTPERTAKIKAMRDAYWEDVRRQQEEAEAARKDLNEQSELMARALLGSMLVVMAASFTGGVV